MILETNRLILRNYTAADLDALHEILSDPETMAHYPHPFQRHETRRWIEWNEENYRLHGFGLWAVTLKETGQLIGDCGITMQTIDGRLLPELGYHIHKAHWRRGYAREAAAAVRDWAFTHTGFDALYSYTRAANAASIATAASIGMKKEKEYTDPMGIAIYVSALTRDQWQDLIASP